LQELPVDIGQRVGPGTNLARVANPNKLKAELNISATQRKICSRDRKFSIEQATALIPGELRT